LVRFGAAFSQPNKNATTNSADAHRPAMGDRRGTFHPDVIQRREYLTPAAAARAIWRRPRLPKGHA